MADVGAALQSAAKTFYGTYLAASDNKRREERDAEEDRWRRVQEQLALRQEERLAKSDERQWQVQERNLKLLDGQISEMERTQGEVQKFIDEMGFSPELWAMKTDVEKFEMAQEMHALTKEQIQANMAATRAASAYRAAMMPYEQEAARMNAERARFGFEMDKAEYENFKSTKGLREAEGLVNTIQAQLDNTNELLKGYVDENTGMLGPGAEPLLARRAELSSLIDAAVTNKFTPEMYKSLGIDPEAVKAKSASSEGEAEAMRIQQRYGRAGASARAAEERARVEEERAKKQFEYFYVDETGRLQGTNDPVVIQDLEKKAPDRVLQPEYVHGYMVGQPYAPRASTKVRKGLLGGQRYALPDTDAAGVDALPFTVGY